MNLIQSGIKMMSSREISELTGKKIGHIHRDFKKMMSDLGVDNNGLMPNPFLDQGFSYEMDDQNRISAINLNQELTLTLVSGYNAKLRNSIINRWQELEANQAPQIPQTYAAALIEAGRLAQIVDEQAEKLVIAAPKVEYHDKVLASDNGLITTEIASELGMSAIALNRLLRDLKVQRKVGGRWVLTAAMLGQGLTIESTFIDENGNARHAMKWTEAGRKLIHELLEC